MATRTIVRCARGALFTTIWLPLGSLKAIRIGRRRIQRCPVHKKWETVKRVDPSSLSASEIASARAVRDIGIP